MNIEIQNPEIEQRVRAQIQSGRFHDVEELLEEALDALEKNGTAAVSAPPRERPSGRKSLVELFAESPLKGLEFDFSRNRSGARPVDLS